MKPIISTNDLTIKYGEHTLLSNINLEILPGELIKLKGPNGAGKTSLLELLIGIKKSDNVKRYFDDDSYSYLPQMSKIDPKLSLNLEDICSTEYSFYPKEIFKRHWSVASGGEKMKSLIAKTITEAKDIIFLDEPFNHLDKASSSMLIEVIKQRIDQGLTVVYIGHEDLDMNQRVIEVNQRNP